VGCTEECDPGEHPSLLVSLEAYNGSASASFPGDQTRRDYTVNRLLQLDSLEAVVSPVFGKSLSVKMSMERINGKVEEPGLPYHETPSSQHKEKRVSTSKIRTEATAFVGEFIGTFMFLSLAFTGTQIALNAAGSNQLTSSGDPAPDVSKLLYIAFAFGMSLAINVAIFADISGGKFNPAVSFSLAVVVPPSLPAWCNHNNGVVNHA
jgi:hypothetical protein